MSTTAASRFPLAGNALARRLRALSVVALAATALFAGRCYNKKDYSPTAPATADALTLTTANQQTSLPADGVSRLRIIARISPDADADKRTVLFSTTAGTLVGTANASGQIAVAADVTGTATVELKSAQQVGIAVVTAQVQNVSGLSRQINISFTSADAGSVIQFVTAPASAPADGATISSFTVQLSPSLPLGTQVQFQATAGLFQPENAASVTRTADGSYRVSADLASPTTIGSARVTATANNVSQQTTINFVRALPNIITVSTGGTFTVTPSTSSGVTVTGTFLRDIGMVTAGTVATFRAFTSDGTAIGFFRDVTTVSSSGTATATFLAGQTDYRGPVTIIVGAQGTSVTGSTGITIVDP
ncbi:MAG TPA: hypothetical protein VGS57_19665 [Thermoanaerobaculia bacterium]|nr:hypothetical protein [Thermoanaerobaculia bacterium]